MPPKANPEQKMEECISILKSFIENMTKVITTSFEKHSEALQSEIFAMRKEVEAEKKMRRQCEEEISTLKGQLKYVHGELQYMLDKQEAFEQDLRLCDVVMDLEDQDVSDPKGQFCEIVNKTLMGKVIEKDDVKKVTVKKNNRTKRMSLIATMDGDHCKKAILKQKKMFREKKIYVKENLTSQRYKLLKEARDFAAKYNFKFVWTNNCNIFLRRDEFSSVIPVRNVSTLSSLSDRGSVEI